MERDDVNVCILRVGGTNCDAETKRAFEELGANADIVHLNDLVKKRSLLNYQGLVLPGGFSYGDYVRAGAILAKALVAKLGSDLKQFVADERPILGICNGFQILTEAGLLPGFDQFTGLSQACLATNIPVGYRCMWIHLRHENRGKCIFTSKVKQNAVLHIPVAHGEGRFMFEKEKERDYLGKLIENDQLVIRYCAEDGQLAEGRFPINPNGAFQDIAGICDTTGTIFGLMPHPERSYNGWQQPDSTKGKQVQRYGDGKLIFQSMTDHMKKKF